MLSILFSNEFCSLFSHGFCSPTNLTNLTNFFCLSQSFSLVESVQSVQSVFENQYFIFIYFSFPREAYKHLRKLNPFL